MKKQIFDALKTKYKNLGFSDTSFDAVAGFLEPTVTEEANIETAISGVETLLKGFQSDADKRVTTAVAKAKSEKQEPGAPAKEEPIEQIKVEAPEWVKELTEKITEISSELSVIKAAKTTDNRKSLLETKLEGAPEFYKKTVLKSFERMRFDDEDQFTTFLSETEIDAKEQMQEFANQGLSSIPRPTLGKPNSSGVLPVTQEYLEMKKAEAAGTGPTQGKQVFQNN